MFLRFFAEKVMLGRWKPTDFKTNKIKIDWANVDHCGTCAYKAKVAKAAPEKALVVRPQHPLARLRV